MLGPDDETPARPRTPVDPDALALAELHLVFNELSRLSCSAAERMPALEAFDRADVLSLFRRRVEAARDRLTELLATWPRTG
jgi:hypothetical protein